METRYPVEGQFGSEFPAICNVIIAELWRPEVASPGNFVSSFCVFGKTTPYGKIYKILFGKFSPPHRSTLCSDGVKFVRREIGEIVRYLPDKKHTKFRLPLNLKLSLLRGSRPKICQGQPPTIC